MKNVDMKTIITAHSGCDGTIDNSIEYIKYALSHNCDCFEVDVRMEQGQLVLSHDNVTGADELVRLEEVFKLMRETNSKINCDLKEDNLEEDVFDLAKKHGVENKLIYTGTVDIEKFKEENKMTQAVDVYINVEAVSDYFSNVYSNSIIPYSKKLKEELAYLCGEIKDYKIAGLNMDYRYCDDDMLSFLKDIKMPVSLWTVDDETEAPCLIKAKVKNITTRKFSLLQNIRRSYETTK